MPSVYVYVKSKTYHTTDVVDFSFVLVTACSYCQFDHLCPL